MSDAALTASISVRPIRPPAPATTIRNVVMRASPAEPAANPAPPARVLAAHRTDDAIRRIARIAADRGDRQLVVRPLRDLVVLEQDGQPVLFAQPARRLVAVHVIPAVRVERVGDE